MKLNWICPNSCYEELDRLSNNSIKTINYHQWKQLIRVVKSDIKLKIKLENNLKIKEKINLLKMLYLY